MRKLHPYRNCFIVIIEFLQKFMRIIRQGRFLNVNFSDKSLTLIDYKLRQDDRFCVLQKKKENF